jgi:hypothetical protein
MSDREPGSVWHMARAASHRPLPAARKPLGPVYPPLPAWLSWHEAKRAMVLDGMVVVDGPWIYSADDAGVIWMRHRDGGQAVISGFWNRRYPDRGDARFNYRVDRGRSER